MHNAVVFRDHFNWLMNLNTKHSVSVFGDHFNRMLNPNAMHNAVVFRDHFNWLLNLNTKYSVSVFGDHFNRKLNPTTTHSAAVFEDYFNWFVGRILFRFHKLMEVVVTADDSLFRLTQRSLGVEYQPGIITKHLMLMVQVWCQS